MEPLDELLLIGGVLRGQPEHFCPCCLHLGVMVAKSAGLRGASPGPRDEIPVGDEWRLARPPGSRICVHDNPASIDRRQRDRAAVCGWKRNVWDAGVSNVI